MSSFLFIYNPKAGKKFDSNILDELKKHFSKDYRCTFIAIQELNRDFNFDGYDVLVAIGGDGTVNTVAAYCVRHQKILGIIPKGSGDGLARHLNLKGSLADLTHVLKAGQVLVCDTARINNEFFINIAGTGFEAEVAHTFAQLSARGLHGYFRAIVSSFSRTREQHIKMTVDGVDISLNVFNLSFANGAQWGNNFEIASKAHLQDGMIEIVVMRKPKWYHLPSLIAYLKTSQHRDTALLTNMRAQHIKIHENSGRWHIDGEPIEMHGDVMVKVEPKSIRILVPR